MHRVARTNYDRLRINLLRRGLSLRAWALQHNHPLGTVYNAARGLRDGPRSRQIRAELEAFTR